MARGTASECGMSSAECGVEVSEFMGFSIFDFLSFDLERGVKAGNFYRRDAKHAEKTTGRVFFTTDYTELVPVIYFFVRSSTRARPASI